MWIHAMCQGRVPKVKIVHKVRENTKIADRLANIAINTREDSEEWYAVDAA